MPTKQETFDLIVNHIREQGERSIAGCQCRYRLIKNGKLLKCAAGFLIPDDQYKENFEGYSVAHPPIEEIIKNLGHDVGLVCDLQDCHDQEFSEDFLPKFEIKVRDTAEEYSLIYTEPTKE